MGVSTDGQLSFGINFDEDTELLPWLDDKYDQEIEKWWRSVNDYPGKNYPEDGYYQDQDQWDKENPCPVEEVMHCSYDCCCYIVAVKGKTFSASRGDPSTITQKDMELSFQQIGEFKKFLTDYEIETNDEPAWLLSSLWG